ncbi:acyl-CoA thioesterase [Hoeflea sp. TYP-13]|uniref:acyl-CoA thioesterase n=1 Tax=Hoeflea sp. TYP-13 TaxID=3230023 RepID=UPI0034C65085
MQELRIQIQGHKTVSGGYSLAMPTNKTISRNRESYSLWTPVSIRYSDQDPMDHVNNVAITAFLESGRVGLFQHIFGDMLPSRGVVLASLTVDYLNEITFPGSVEVGGMLAAFGDRSMTTHYAIFQNDTCCVLSQSVNVFFDPVRRRSTEPSSDVKAMLERYLARTGSRVAGSTRGIAEPINTGRD